MLQLFLLRHAKSDWSSPGEDDFDRPLSKRGEKAAPQIGRYMEKHDLHPALVMCSSAKRAQQTMQLVLPELSTSPQIDITDDLYSFGGTHKLVNIIRKQQPSPLMIVAHNPSLEYLTKDLTATGSSSARARLAEKFPTAALAVLEFDIPEWKHLQTGIGTLVHFIRPRDL